MRLGHRHDAVSLVESAFAALSAGSVLDALRSVPGDRYFLVGGSVRDLLLDEVPRDLDLVIPNADEEIHRCMRKTGHLVHSVRRNRHGNWRYVFQNFHVDLIEPRYFYRPFTHPAEVLSFFDASINAVGISLGDGVVLDPIAGVVGIQDRTITLPEERWNGVSDFESVHLVLRILRLLDRFPFLVTNAATLAQHVAKFETVDWRELARLNGLGRPEALAALSRHFPEIGSRA
jgi:tRNA nucleotidyltransferase/poly(A) polymerase